jgi:hypothetical protein
MAETDGGRMIFAYADPPYIGQAKKHYSHDPNCAEVDHKQLIEIMTDKYDGWALSCSSPSLREILPYCPDKIHIGAWVKPFASFKPGVNPSYSWEPVIFYGGRKRGRDMQTVKDFISENITLRKGLSGVKPENFCFWIFEMLNIRHGDLFDDLFPGSGAVTKALDVYLNQNLFNIARQEAEPDKARHCVQLSILTAVGTPIER